jgi:hypothetical protein
MNKEFYTDFKKHPFHPKQLRIVEDMDNEEKEMDKLVKSWIKKYGFEPVQDNWNKDNTFPITTWINPKNGQEFYYSEIIEYIGLMNIEEIKELKGNG